MGITRIVEGDLINTSTSMNLSANDGNYEFHAAGKNKWQGDENGIIEGNYEPPSKENSLSNSINVRLNLFFDGTTNNKTNTEARNESSKNHETYIKEGNKNDDSFENDYTNVARGFDTVDPSAENQVAVYIEGIGTEDLKGDTKFPGVATGQGDTGVTAKVTKGCMKAAVEMSKNGYNGKDIDILYVNVYGFSRGAAAARHFIHVASKSANYHKIKRIDDKKTRYGVYPEYFFNDSKYQPEFVTESTALMDKYGYFGACLLSQGMKIKDIRFNFVGIYDTVASFGLDHRGKKVAGIQVVDGDTQDLFLDSIKKSNYVFHLASDDEYRDNFDLTNINSAGLNGLELTLPGVHSDIGGSYLNEVIETSVIDNQECADTPDAKNTAKYYYEKKYDAFKKIVVEEGWYLEKQLTKEFFYEKDLDPFTSFIANQHNYGLIGRRKLFNTYDKISLKLMVESSKTHGNVVYDGDMLIKHEIKDNFINSFYNQLVGYINACIDIRNLFVKEYNNNISQANFDTLSKEYIQEIKREHYSRYVELEDLKTLRNQYLHWSAKDNLFGLEPIKTGALPQNERKRNIQDG